MLNATDDGIRPGKAVDLRLLGVPLGIGLFAAAWHAGIVAIPPAWWLAGAMLGILAGVATLASLPARVGARRPPGEIRQAESA